MAGEKVEVKFESKLLNQLLRNMKKHGYVKVGILNSSKNSRSDSELNNASIGAVHEFGLKNSSGKEAIPERSFLRMPLQDDFDTALEAKSDPKQLAEDLVKNPKGLFEKIGNVALGVITEAFDQGGSSKTKWKSLNPEYAKTKKVNQILVETQQLRESITYEVEGSFE